MCDTPFDTHIYTLTGFAGSSRVNPSLPQTLDFLGCLMARNIHATGKKERTGTNRERFDLNKVLEIVKKTVKQMTRSGQKFDSSLGGAVFP